MPQVNAYSLERLHDDLEHLISQERENPAFFTEAQELLKKLLPNREFVCHVMELMLSDDAFLKGRIGTIDKNDMIISLSPKGSFSIRLFISLPSVQYPIHDHGAWGIIGAYINKFSETKYHRLDDSSVEGYARLEEKSRRILSPGDTTCVLPLGDGIHRISSADNNISLTLNLYGKPLRSGFYQCFNIQENTVYKSFTPKLEKRLFALRVLGEIGGAIVKAHIEKAFREKYVRVMEAMDNPEAVTSQVQKESNSEPIPENLIIKTP